MVIKSVHRCHSRDELGLQADVIQSCAKPVGDDLSRAVEFRKVPSVVVLLSRQTKYRGSEYDGYDGRNSG